jgi:methionyl-tRNA formyltransferase
LSLRLIFMGTPDFAVPALAALVDAGHEIAAVYSQPPRPAGRGRHERPSPVHSLAAARGFPVRTPATLKSVDSQAAFAALGADVAVVAAYGLILPKAVLQAPRLGCLNVHASLLPRWRGAAPIQRAILAGDEQTGITIMQMDEGLDTGAILLQESLPLSPGADAGALHDALAALGARLIVTALSLLPAGRLTAEPQSAAGVTYAAKIGKDEARLDWRRPASDVERAVRAFAPAPAAWFEHAGERFKVLAGCLAEGGGPPGLVLDDRLTVACGTGALRLLKIQRAGKAPMETAAFLRGFALPPGTRLAIP